MSVKEDLDDLVQRLQAAYHSSSSTALVPDDIYEIVRERLAELDPGNPVLSSVGAAVSSDDDRKVPLPAWMAALAVQSTNSVSVPFTILARRKRPSQSTSN